MDGNFKDGNVGKRGQGIRKIKQGSDDRSNPRRKNVLKTEKWTERQERQIQKMEGVK